MKTYDIKTVQINCYVGEQPHPPTTPHPPPSHTIYKSYLTLKPHNSIFIKQNILKVAQKERNTKKPGFQVQDTTTKAVSHSFIPKVTNFSPQHFSSPNQTT